MKKQIVYDLPMRIFHWFFAGLFVTAVFIAKTIDDDSPVFSYHMLSGLLLVGLVTLRIIWGFIGTRHSKFSSFALHPKDLITYFKGIFSGSPRKWSGHNPASSWAAITMFALTLGLGISGVLMSKGYEEAYEDIHELLANAFLLVVLLHISGVFLHAIRHRDGIPLSMIHGAKSDVVSSETISHTRPLVGVLFIGLIAFFAFTLISNFDTQKRSLNLLGFSLQLGDAEDTKNEAEENSDKNSLKKADKSEKHEDNDD